jgi:hypothetical protein
MIAMEDKRVMQFNSHSLKRRMSNKKSEKLVIIDEKE